MELKNARRQARSEPDTISSSEIRPLTVLLSRSRRPLRGRLAPNDWLRRESQGGLSTGTKRSAAAEGIVVIERMCLFDAAIAYVDNARRGLSEELRDALSSARITKVDRPMSRVAVFDRSTDQLLIENAG